MNHDEVVEKRGNSTYIIMLCIKNPCIAEINTCNGHGIALFSTEAQKSTMIALYLDSTPAWWTRQANKLEYP